MTNGIASRSARGAFPGGRFRQFCYSEVVGRGASAPVRAANVSKGQNGAQTDRSISLSHECRSPGLARFVVSSDMSIAS
jgi:hypothetical protein